MKFRFYASFRDWPDFLSRLPFDNTDNVTGTFDARFRRRVHVHFIVRIHGHG